MSELITTDNKYDLKKLWGHQKEVVRLKTLGYKNVQIAAALNIHPQTVSNILGTKLAKKQMEILAGERDASATDIRERITAMQPVALEVIEDTMLNPNEDPRITPKMQKEAALDVMKMGGNGPLTRTSEESPKCLSSDQKQDIKKLTMNYKGFTPVEEVETVEVRDVED